MITWKLGGSWEHESLTVLGPSGFGTFSGQHFARILPDGSLTLHDNRTKEGQGPRLIHFGLDLHARALAIRAEMAKRFANKDALFLPAP